MSWGGVCGRGGIHGRGACMTGHVWWGVPVWLGGVHGGGHMWQGGVCGGTHAPLPDTTGYGQ